jgi:hypothetical protein
MSALFVGDRASTAVLGLSPWVIPLIAVAAKLTYEQARNAIRGEVAQNRPGDEENGRQEDLVGEVLNDGLAANAAKK